MMSSYQSDIRTSSMTRGKAVKPLLRKFTQSEKNSIDLDRPYTEQDGLGIYDFGRGAVHDVAFTHTNRRGYHHRSTSGTSQFSTATSGSGPRTGSFVHPFQQTPRPYTPPSSKSYQGSYIAREDSDQFTTTINNNYSPALTEDEEIHHRDSSTTTTNGAFRPAEPLARVSTSSSNTKPLRVQTKQYSSSSSRLARESHTSLSSTLMLAPDYASPTDTISPTSAIRSSIDDLGMRLRSRSDSNYRNADTIEEARRKWDLEQKQKEERYARKEIKKLEKVNKADAKERVGGGHHRRSSASEATRSKRSRSDLTIQQEKQGMFEAYDYDTVQTLEPPVIGREAEGPERLQKDNSAKKKANSTFQVVLMWFRTRILRMKKKSSS